MWFKKDVNYFIIFIMQHPYPISLLKKKIKNQCIYYKFLMNNGSYTSEPMN